MDEARRFDGFGLETVFGEREDEGEEERWPSGLSLGDETILETVGEDEWLGEMVLDAEHEAAGQSTAEWLEAEWLDTSGETAVGETLEAFCGRLGREWSQRSRGTISPEGMGGHEYEGPIRVKPVDLSAAKNVMAEVMRQLANAGFDPGRSDSYPAQLRSHLHVFKAWHEIVQGTPSAKGRVRLRGEPLGDKIEAAFSLTEPYLAVVRKQGGADWRKVLRLSFYDPVAKLELEAIQSGPVTRRAPKVEPITFADRPAQQITSAQFFGLAGTKPSEPIPLQQNIGGIQVGWVRPGMVFEASLQDRRLVLWTGSIGVIFIRGNGVIYAQSAGGFAHDIIYGVFVVAAQNAAGAMMLAQLMVELALSFTPWGRVWDVVSALKAATEGDWKGAALAILPGPAVELAAMTRAFRTVAKGAAIAAKFGKAIAQQAFKYIARGAYVLNGKLLRGFWLVGENSASGAKNFRFLDEITETIHDVPPIKAQDYIVCSQCRIPPRAQALARKAQVNSILQEVLANPSYRSGGKVLIKPKLIEDVVAAYGDEAEDVIGNILTAFEGTKDAAKHASDTLEVAKTLSSIKSRGPRGTAIYQDAIDIFADLAAHPFTARGAMFELEWAAKHVDEIAAMGVPTYKKGWRGVGKGLDVMTTKGAAVELKNYNFTHQIYTDDPARSVSRIANQAKLRLAFKKPAVTEVRFVFDSRTRMPDEFRKLLEAELAALTNSSGRKVGFEFWPPVRRR